ncbi:UBA domain-containing protein [Plasmodiophora brassicae]|uniref:UBA domain-containing protein n=1 Tax=Plasmodiophora brassicae TaxID=37360 RepID=A0A0G4IT31_PLABS|nr:hypothetical protein PBRA_006496 [Plasmodiophora brassicae]SPQ94467.1 unnamed protein product [Plasmodiophora brassicae]
MATTTVKIEYQGRLRRLRVGLEEPLVAGLARALSAADARALAVYERPGYERPVARDALLATLDAYKGAEMIGRLPRFYVVDRAVDEEEEDRVDETPVREDKSFDLCEEVPSQATEEHVDDAVQEDLSESALSGCSDISEGVIARVEADMERSFSSLRESFVVVQSLSSAPSASSVDRIQDLSQSISKVATDYSNELDHLESLGFPNRKLNASVLYTHDLDVERAAQALARFTHRASSS